MSEPKQPPGPQLISAASIFYLRPDAPIKLIVSAYDDKGLLHLWIQRGPDSFQVLHPVDMVEGMYLSRSKRQDTDFFFPFFAWAIQKSFSKSLHDRLENIVSDVSNLATSIEKLDLFYRHGGDGSTLFARTEVEYICIVCRSMYDLCQEIISEWWASINLLDTTVKKKPLKKSFTDMVLYKGLPRSESDYGNFGLPKPWVDFYLQSAPFFLKLRDLRDGIVHRGTSIPLIFGGAPGFSVATKDRLFSPFNIWKAEHLLKNDLGSLRSLVAHWIKETLNTTNLFAETMQKTIKLPEDLAPGYLAFIRSKHIHHLNRLDQYIDNGWGDANPH